MKIELLAGSRAYFVPRMLREGLEDVLFLAGRRDPVENETVMNMTGRANVSSILPSILPVPSKPRLLV
jgi:hypothetical protein